MSIQGDSIILNQSNQKNIMDEFDFLIVSSTSWTEDEDFGILLRTLSKLDKILTANLRKYGKNSFLASKVLVIITGKGPLKEAFLAQFSQIQSTLNMVALRTPWLEPEDYPTLVSCADVGLCLHSSTSGLDLPMKVITLYFLLLLSSPRNKI